MHGLAKDRTGQRYGKLKVLRLLPERQGGSLVWLCRCDCGNTTKLRGNTLSAGAVKSCGCLRAPHGKSRTAESYILKSAVQRCHNKNAQAYANYGARGIRVCKRWRESDGRGLINFLADMGPRPRGATLERKNNSKGYSPTNCVWATRRVQTRNMRTNVWITYKGRRMILADWAAQVGLPYMTLWARLKKGWPVKRALETPRR